MTVDAPGSAVVIGAGLIGTSVALALRAAGTQVLLSDADPAAEQLAADMGAGESLRAAGPTAGPADIAVLAVPPAAVAGELAAAQQGAVARCYTDVASVKQLPLTAARALGCDLTSFVPGHPLSGRERSGPAAARADLFLGRPWVICPVEENAAGAVIAVTGLARACGGQPVMLSAADHDRYVALVSHVPHLVAAAVAAGLEHAPPEALILAGQGVRDVTRIAAGSPDMWGQILSGNAGPVGELLAEVASELDAAAAGLGVLAGGNEEARKVLTDLLERGRAGVARLPGKRGGPAPEYAMVQVVIPDRPGELARLFQVVGEAGINIEDVDIEHSPGLPVGVAELWVRPDAVDAVTGVLAAGGWPVRR